MRNKNFLLLFLCILFLAIFTTACGGGKSTPPNYPFIPVPTPTPTPTPTPAKYPLELSQTQFTLNVGATGNITVTLNGEDITQTATYTVDEEAIASVEQGLITGLSAGFTTVIVHAENAIEDKTFTVNVIDPNLPTLEVTPSEVTLGLTDETTVIVTLEGKDVTKEVTYKSNDESIATAEKGKVTAGIVEGTAKIAVSLTGANSAIFTVNVINDADEVALNDIVLGQLGYKKVFQGYDPVTGWYHYDIYKDGNIVTNIDIPAVYTYDVKNGKRSKKYKITSIQGNCFYECTSLESVTIPETVTIIGEHSFERCSSLTNITISNSVTDIEEYAFAECYSLKSITIPDSVVNIGIYVFQKCIALESITIPDSVISIGKYAFQECTALKSINIGNGLKGIEACTFEEASSLESITIPDNIEYIDYKAFNLCTALKSIYIGKGVRIIGPNNFSQCPLNTLTVDKDNDFLWIFPCTFSGCNQLTEITKNGSTIPIPTDSGIVTKNNITFVDSKLDNLTDSVIQKIEIPEQITLIPSYAFYGNKKLKEATLNKGIKIIKETAFQGCTALKSITIPEGVTSIESQAFKGCTALEEMTIPNSATYMGDYVFKNCTSLEEMTISDSVTHIGKEAFCDCTALKNITLSKNLTIIESFTFAGCENLNNVTIPEGVTVIANSAFGKSSNNKVCYSLTTMTISDNVLLICPLAFEGSSLGSLKTKTGSIDIDVSGFAQRGNVTFVDATSKSDITEIIIPEGVTIIPTEAFRNYGTLEEVTIPDTVTTIEFDAFYSCDNNNLSIKVPSTVTTIESYAFYNVNNIKITEEQKSLLYYPWGAKKVNGEEP